MLRSLFAVAVAASGAIAQPTVRVIADDTRIDRSCVVEIPEGAIIPDTNGDGVIHIVADGITVTFSKGSVLRGALVGLRGDQHAGVGIRIDGRTNVTLADVQVSGYRVGLSANDCDGLTLGRGNFWDNYRQLLKSTPAAEDGGDWLYPHHNDKGEWVGNHGAAVSVKNASNVEIRGVRVRSTQNGIVLDRVNGSRIYDNDCSFLSGWGLALWRSSGNTISRNALDFCIRGYSHGVYNRGQDSAGLLMFEQCSNNIIVENSITHGGDGIFGFAGREAIGEGEAPEGFSFARRGCNDNLFAGNDLSYAAAHGLEMTFSHGNRVFKNRMVGNAICGIWGGYSTEMLIVGNEFAANGDMAYGLERGGINIEHGSRNRIIGNTFRDNACAIHLWWDDDGALLTRPGVRASGSDVADNFIAGNLFAGNAIALQLRDTGKDTVRVTGTVFAGNEVKGGREIDAPERISIRREGPVPEVSPPPYEALGQTRPVGARASLAGRQNIIMTEWGPWDHDSPLVRPLTTTGGVHRYELRKLPPDATFAVNTSGPTPITPRWEVPSESVSVLTIEAPGPGVTPYTFAVRSTGYSREFSGSVIKAAWDVAAFAWEGSLNPPLPPGDLEAWRERAKGESAVRARVDSLSFKFGYRGPKGIGSVPEFAASSLGGNLYGLVATTSLPLTPGRWRVTTISDDGVRVMADGGTVIENWTHHGPTTDRGEFVVTAAKEVAIVVEYFQIGGHAELDFKIEPVP